MKKLLSLILAFTLVGCSSGSSNSASSSEVAFKAGTYTASSDGNNGPVTVSVTFSDSEITSVEVTDQSETPSIAETALTTIPQEIVEQQSIGVDIVTGSTRTSEAILNAVADCITQAGANPEDYKTAVAPVESTEDRTETVDVLVIGGGGTGLSAAMSAIDNGAESVMVVEKLGRLGGSTSVSGAVVAAEDTYYTRETGIETDYDKWLAEWKASSDSDIGVIGKDPGFPTYDRVSQYFLEVGETVNWLQDNGVATWVEYPYFPGMKYQVPDYLISDGAADPEGGHYLIEHMASWLEDKGADVRLNTSGTKLITNDDGDVIGATVEDKSGSYDVYTNKGVVLATGGFAASEEMMEKYLPQFADWIDLTTAGAGDTGDGMRMAEEVGGVMYSDPYVITLGSTSRNSTLNPFCMSVNLWYRMVVGSDGKRFFDEGGMPYQATVALSQTSDGVAWALGDSTFEQVDLLDAAVDGTEVVKADTIEELAEAMGVDVDTLVASVNTYNEASKTGVDSEFGKSAAYLSPISTAPYYAVRIYVCTGGTIAGVKTNSDYQVIKEDGTAIKGLYAGGETSNREMYAYAYSSGSGVGYALASGHTIGVNIMK